MPPMTAPTTIETIAYEELTQSPYEFTVYPGYRCVRWVWVRGEKRVRDLPLTHEVQDQ